MMKKILNTSAMLIIISILSPILAQVMANAIINKSETPNESVAIIKANESISVQKVNIAKKRIKIHDEVLVSDFLFEIFPHLDRILSVIIILLTIMQTTKYAVWSKSTFS
jgi:hypothetical protein